MTRTTRNRYGSAAKLVSAVALAGLFAGGIALGAAVTVSIGRNGPSPATVTVQWGDTVTFKNDDDSPHGITIPRVAVASPILPPGGTWARIFDGRTGSYYFRQTEGRGHLGSVIVQLTGRVTMKATPIRVSYGKRVSFAGTALPGYPVLLEQLVVAQAGQWVERMTVTAGPDGKWSTSLVPKLGARFRATAAAGQLRSPPVSVGVEPTISLVRPAGAKAGTTVAVSGRISPVGAAKTADLERYDAARRRWVRQDRGTVTKSGAVSFRWKAVKGRSQLRVNVQRYALKPGFEPTASRPIAVSAS